MATTKPTETAPHSRRQPAEIVVQYTNDTPVRVEEGETFTRILVERAAADPARVHSYTKRRGAWVPTTIGELATAVEEIGAGLVDLGLAKGDAANLLGATNLEWTQCDFGAQAAGLIVAPIYHTVPAAEAAYIVENSQARLLFCETARAYAQLAPHRADLPALEHVVILRDSGDDGPDDSGVITLADLRERGRAALAADRAPFDARRASVAPDDVMTFIYTSGTTGNPKGCVITNFQFLYVTRSIGAVLSGYYEPSDSTLLFLPLAHAFARCSQFESLDLGSPIYYAESVAKVMDNLRETRPTTFPSVPRIFEKIYTRMHDQAKGSAVKLRVFDWAMDVGRQVAAVQDGDAQRPVGGLLGAKRRVADRLVYAKVRAALGDNIRCFVTGGAAIAPDIAAFFQAMGFTICEGYGMTETSTAATLSPPDGVRIGSVGPPLPGMTIGIAKDGEVMVKAPNVFSGYFRNPEATDEALSSDGWLHTGDIGELSDDGYLKITDRKKDLIVTAGGKNLAPGNIEGALKSDPLISQALIYGSERPYVVALVTLDEEELAHFARAKGLEGDYAALIADETVRADVARRIEKANGRLAKYETVKRVDILEHDFSIEEGELTPTLKLKRNVVARKYRDRIEALYDGGGFDTMPRS